MAPTAEARARYARELVEHTMRQFTAARETPENPSSAAKRKHPAAHAARDGPRGRPARATNTSPRIISPPHLVLSPSSCCLDPPATDRRTSRLVEIPLYPAIVSPPAV
ncbi:hypothetical protein DFH06DRAFT_1328903 [Mycena polygramma]|nr:hypothetical protein DFH06DRAFT_1328893 [Mycena polygramma]KAJ7656075.1 hypothetical protein DFH06DRAFT_1328903 [Mycena polygramma]